MYINVIIREGLFMSMQGGRKEAYIYVMFHGMQLVSGVFSC